MDILGIGPLEFFFVVLIALIVLGPRDMAKAGRTVGRILRNIVQSDTWRAVQAISKDMRNLPTRLMREANLEEDVKLLQVETQQIRRQLDMSQVTKDIQRAQEELAKESQDALSDWTTPPEDETPSIRPPQIPGDAPAPSAAPGEWTQPEQPAAGNSETSPASKE
jgi:sec-independent protein translocase protein TatB